MAGNGDGGGLFEGLPPPSAPAPAKSVSPPPPVSAPRSLKSVEPAKPAIKRPAPQDPAEGAKQVRFKTTTETSKEKVIEALHKIKTHIGNPSKFSKACKLALQLLDAGSVGDDETSTLFFEMLEVAMSPPTKANAAAVRADYQQLFSAVQDKLNSYTPSQQEQIEVWALWAQLGNDFYTDDTFVFSRAAGRLKQLITALPEAVAEDAVESNPESTADAEEVDPFGLDALLPNKEDKCKKKAKNETTGGKNLQRDRREALIECLTIAAKRYKQAWAQTIVDIAAKHAFDNTNRFDQSQRERIVKLCVSVREQQVKRKQGKGSSGKLDETSFEKYRELYSHEKISIRKAVGGGGDRSAEQWLG
ncbi:uncharacterized protein LOC9660724 [Selaginella moellendorffii]|nr:uncharacterized protein LOC9660724 [Selaginella moellendorffii]|eukprot:XP_002979276.2 uncharacterized protein LOC9660724 [Selaginella moellendorffii]